MPLIFALETLFLHKVVQEFPESLAWVQPVTSNHLSSVLAPSEFCNLVAFNKVTPLALSYFLLLFQVYKMISASLRIFCCKFGTWMMEQSSGLVPLFLSFFRSLFCMVLNTVSILTHINLKSSGQVVIIRFMNSPRPSYPLLRECVCWNHPCGVMHLFFRNLWTSL